MAKSAYYGLYALQHRGQESCGIVVNDSGVFSSHTDLGLVPDVFGWDTLEKLGSGSIALGHVRYSTAAKAIRTNAQPLVIRHGKGNLAIAHNGSLVNAHTLKEHFEQNGSIFHCSTNTEVIAYAITTSRLKTKSIEEAVEAAAGMIKGAFSIVIMSPQKLIAVRDPNGFRPLCMGKTQDGAVVFASESCALSAVGAEFVRDIDPGEIVVASESGVKSIRTYCDDSENNKNNKNNKTGSLCVFEFVYFARPDSVVDGFSVHEARRRAGMFLAEEHPVEADVVIGVPDSGIDAALGYSCKSGIPFGTGFIKNRYVGRSFIQPTQGQREDAVKVKLSVIKSVVEGKRVVMIDDSIVRGTTSARIVGLIKEAGAAEVHLRISSPPFVNPCYFGTDINSKEKLIACRMNMEEIRKHINVDSLGYLSKENILKIADCPGIDFCDACFTGDYPVEIIDNSFDDKYDSKLPGGMLNYALKAKKG